MAGGIKKFVVGCFDDETGIVSCGEECSQGRIQDPRCVHTFPCAWS